MPFFVFLSVARLSQKNVLIDSLHTLWLERLPILSVL